METYIPSDAILQTLLYSDIDTIVKTCITSSYNMHLCDANFWHQKFNYDKLPLIDTPHNFTAWVKLYKRTKEAMDLVKMYSMYHYQQAYNFIFLLDNYVLDILPYDLVEELQIYDDEYNVIINIAYHPRDDEWVLTRYAGGMSTAVINYLMLININAS